LPSIILQPLFYLKPVASRRRSYSQIFPSRKSAQAVSNQRLLSGIGRHFTQRFSIFPSLTTVSCTWRGNLCAPAKSSTLPDQAVREPADPRHLAPWPIRFSTINSDNNQSPVFSFFYSMQELLKKANVMRYDTYAIKTGKLHKTYLNNFLIAVTDVPEHPDYPEHSHEFTELVVVYEGCAINCVDGFEYPISAGDVFVIHEGARHSYLKTEHLHLCNVIFDSSLLRIRSIDVNHLPGYHALFELEPKMRKNNFNSRLHLQSKELAKARDLIEKLEYEVDEKAPGFRLISQSLLLLLIGELSRWHDKNTGTRSNKIMLISKAIAYMEQNYYEQIDISKLAEKAGMSERAFYRVFQEATGETPNQYLTGLRLTHVTELLRHSDIPVTDIAFECGFQDSSYMTKTFKKNMGITPREFRKLNRL
jgi:AraC-like DNA-binding protein/quercetin dioxygenase-like cupin family protein